jgi:hypothetical protein
MMRPSVNRDLVACEVLALEDGRKVGGARANDEEGGFELLLVEVVKQVWSVERRAVVVG